MATVDEIYHYLDEKFPYRLQEPYDNSGIMVDSGRDITQIVVSLDITNAVIEYASSLGAELIVSHHPVIFRPLKRLDHTSPVFRLAAKGISAISAHTNYDIAEGGVNDALASKLDLQKIEPVFPVSGDDAAHRNCIGRAGLLMDEMSPAAFAGFVGEKLLGRKTVEYVDGGRPIRKVAVGGGACGEFVTECLDSGIDAFVTGEAKHHELIFAAGHGLTLVAAGHYATESVALENLAQMLRSGFPSLRVYVTYIDNPLHCTQNI